MTTAPEHQASPQETADFRGTRDPAAFQPLRLRSAITKQPTQSQERPAHRKIETLVLVIFWLLLMEGAIRKWVAPQYAQYLFFVRDPFLLLLYWYALRAGALRGAGRLFQVGMGFAVLAVLLAFAQSITFGDTRLLPVLAYGWRQYFLYMPLPFVMAATLNRDSLLRFARHAFVAIILTAPLVVLQARSSPTAVINRGIAEDVSLQFQSSAFTGGGIRPSGTFTSTVGVSELIPGTFALLLAVWLTPPSRRKIGLPWLVLAAASTAACLAVCGSRAAFMRVAIVMLSALALGFLTRVPQIRRRALMLPVALAVTGGVLYPIVFPAALAAMLTRVSEAHAAESRFSSLGILGRALYEFVEFIDFIPRTPILGYGLGLGGNGRTFLANSNAISLSAIYSESDWSRHIIDLGGIVGVFFILYRIAFTTTLAGRVWRATRMADDPFPMLLFGYVAMGLLYGQLTGHGTVGGFVWLFLGLCMIGCRTAMERR